MSLTEARFFWRHDEPGGIGIGFATPDIPSADLEGMFQSDITKEYMRRADLALGTCVVNHKINQLQSIGLLLLQGYRPAARDMLRTALNIMWLSSRGFIPKDECNGVQFSYAPQITTPRKEAS